MPCATCRWLGSLGMAARRPQQGRPVGASCRKGLADRTGGRRLTPQADGA